MGGKSEMHDLPDLIARLEKATAADRELDAEIYVAIDPRHLWIEKNPHMEPTVRENNLHPKRKSRGNPPIYGTYPAFTASLDAAMTLIPAEANCHGYELDPREVMAYASRNNVKSGHWVHEGYHKTSPAIAICIAALKARLPSPVGAAARMAEREG